MRKPDIMKVINTIEFAPSDYAKNNYEFPDNKQENQEDLRLGYWKKSLADSGITDIEPIEKTSWLVDVEKISDTTLKILVENELKDVDTNNFEEELIALSGGIVISDNNKILITTNCCGDLTDLANWETVFQDNSNEWTQLWIGHPFVYYRNRNNVVEFSNETESNADEYTVVVNTISRDWLKSEIDNIRIAQNALCTRIEKILAEKNTNNRKEIAKILTG